MKQHLRTSVCEIVLAPFTILIKRFLSLYFGTLFFPLNECLPVTTMYSKKSFRNAFCAALWEAGGCPQVLAFLLSLSLSNPNDPLPYGRVLGSFNHSLFTCIQKNMECDSVHFPMQTLKTVSVDFFYCIQPSSKRYVH